MMTKKKTPHIRGVKFVWALPALALLLFAFAEPEYQPFNQNSDTSEVRANYLIPQSTIKLQGTVFDEQGDPLPGTSVVIQGSTVGTVSDLDGTFTIDIPENAKIVLSFVGKSTIVDSYAKIIGVEQKDGAFYRKYTMEDAIFEIEQSFLDNVPSPEEKKIISEKNKMGSPPPPPPPVKDADDKVFYIVEDLPSYPGGWYEFGKYVDKMQQKIAQGKKVKGKAKVAFTVNAKGKVSDIKVVEQDNDGAAKGAYIIASEMPEWTPGKQRGKAVPVKYLLLLEFK